jgi:hypothetical protein
MDFWKSQPRDTNEDEEEGPSRASTLIDRVTDFVKDEALDSAIDTLSGGWLGLDDFQDDDAEDDEPRRGRSGKHDSFEERLQRELAKLAPQAAEPAPTPSANADISETEPAPLPPREYTPSARPIMRGPQGFGRKLV